MKMRRVVPLLLLSLPAMFMLVLMVSELRPVLGQPGPPPLDDGGAGNGEKLCDYLGSDAYYEEEIDGDARIISSGGCPNHWSGCQKMECNSRKDTEAYPQDREDSIPAYPVIAARADRTDLTCAVGTIGVALNGVGVFGQGDGSQDDSCGSAPPLEGDTWDLCGGHVETVNYAYHYHIAPACLIDQLGGEQSGPDGHSPQIGWIFDGFPIYGPRGPFGVPMKPCNTSGANETYCLDECNGWRGEISDVDDFTYRYYAAGRVGDLQCSKTVDNTDSGECQFGTLANDNSDACCVDFVPDDDFFPWMIGCYRGCVYDSDDTDCTDNAVADGYTASYAPKAADSADELYVASAVSNLYDDDGGNGSAAILIACLVVGLLLLSGGLAYYYNKKRVGNSNSRTTVAVFEAEQERARKTHGLERHHHHHQQQQQQQQQHYSPPQGAARPHQVQLAPMAAATVPPPQNYGQATSGYGY